MLLIFVVVITVFCMRLREESESFKAGDVCEAERHVISENNDQSDSGKKKRKKERKKERKRQLKEKKQKIQKE